MRLGEQHGCEAFRIALLATVGIAAGCLDPGHLASTLGTTSAGSSGTGGTAASSSSTSSSPAGTGGTTSVSGTGGGSTAKCKSLSGTITVMSTAELGTNVLIDDLLLVPDSGPAGGDAAVHVTTSTDPAGTWFLRSVTHVFVGGNPLGPLLTLGAQTACTMNADCGTSTCDQTKGTCAANGFTAVAGWVTPGSSLVLEGRLSADVGSVAAGFAEAAFSFSSTDERVQVMAPKYKSWPTPVDCDQGVGSANGPYVWGHAPARYVTACNLNDTSGPYASSLWIGTSDVSLPLVQVASDKLPDALNPSAYAFVNGQHFLVSVKPAGMGVVGATFAHGFDASSLQDPTPLTIVPNMNTILGGLAPLPTNDGFVLFATAVDSAFNNGSLWAGPVKTPDFASLAQTPPPTLKKLPSSSMASALASINSPAVAPQGIVAAGQTNDQTTVKLWWFDDNGTPLVADMEVYTTTPGSIVQAAAAPLGTATLVVWIEKSGSSYAVNAKEYACSQ
jgi:hypothetical protein